MYYSPNAYTHGSDSFSFAVTDQVGSTSINTSTVAIDTQFRNFPPVAVYSSIVTEEDVAVTIIGLGVISKILFYSHS